jgi:hypothetical protein
VLVQVGTEGSGGRREERLSEAGVEGNGVDGVKGQIQGADAGLLEVKDLLDLLVELVGYSQSAYVASST